MFIPKYIRYFNFLSFRDQIFHFRNGEAVLIQGRNKDDLSQKGNGSGKSSLIEGIAVVFTGSPIRDVIAKDLIYNDEKYAELEIELDNQVVNKKLRIWRKIYANTKSAECRIWINDVEKTDLPDINAYNKFIFETLGISKEDFFNFYLITDENGFVPFLKAPDSKKKEIINRFSGADKVDVAIPLIETDSQEKQKEIDTVNTEISRIQANQTLLVEQMEAEEAKLNPDTINVQVEEKRTKIKELEDSIRDKDKKIVVLKNDKRDKEVEVSSFVPTDFDSLLLGKQEEKKVLVSQLTDLKSKLLKCKDKFQPETDAVIARDNKLKTDREEIRGSINEYEQFIDDVNNKLASSIECPSCHHIFSLKDKEFNAQEAKDTLPEAMDTLAELKTQLEGYKAEETAIEEAKRDINTKVLKEQENVREEISKNNIATADLEKEILDISTKKIAEENQLKSLNDAVANIQSAIDIAESSIKNEHIRIKTFEQEIALLLEVDRSKIEELESKAIEFIDKEEQLNEKLQVLTEEKKRIDAWLINFKNFKSHLANKSISHIQDFTNLYLREMGSNISIEIEGYRMLSNKKLKEEITTTVKKDGFVVGAYGKFSRGERVRINICNVLGKQELINLNSPTGGLSLLLCDEVLDACDTLGLENIVNACQGLGKCIMIVSQNEVNIEGHTIIIEKENKVSKILS